MSEGFKKTICPDNSAYITHVIPPKEITDGHTNVDYLSIDVDKTVGVGQITQDFTLKVILIRMHHLHTLWMVIVLVRVPVINYVFN